jgi:drug/metabolite transporter superfamily protein YnfA
MVTSTPVVLEVWTPLHGEAICACWRLIGQGILSVGDYAGEAYAVYGGISIVATLGWLWAVEGTRPYRQDMA